MEASRRRALAYPESAFPNRLAQWVDAIREQNCEILLYSGVGMSPITLQLASLRLAPVQVQPMPVGDSEGKRRTARPVKAPLH